MMIRYLPTSQGCCQTVSHKMHNIMALSQSSLHCLKSWGMC